MSLEGELVVRLDWDGRRVNDVHIRSTSFAASRLLVGRTAGEVRNIVPSLYNLCARAHAAAATVALAAAASESPAAVDVETPSIGVVLETVAEHVRCLLIDWPRALGREPLHRPSLEHDARSKRCSATLVPVALCPQGAPSSAIVADCVYGIPIAQWLQIETVEALQVWLDVASVEPALGLAVLLREHAALGASDIPLMPTVGATTLQDPLAASLARAAEFERYPTWNGSPVETGVLARMQSVPLVRAMLASFGNGVVARIVARLAELAILLQQLAETQAVHWPAVQVCTDATGAGAGRRANGSRPVAASGPCRRWPRHRVSNRRADRMELPPRWPAGERHCAGARLAMRTIFAAGRRSPSRRSIPAWLHVSRWAMHEIALAESMLDIVETTARKHAAHRVTRIRLEIGALSQVSPDALQFFFDAAAYGTLAEHARLDVLATPGEAWCMPCGAAVQLAKRGDACPLVRKLPADRRTGRRNGGQGYRGRRTLGWFGERK